jgi:hypothetical protein
MSATLCGCAGFTLPAEWLQDETDGSARVTAHISGGFLTVSNGGTTCGGEYVTEVAPSPTTTVPMQCADGRAGAVELLVQTNGVRGTLRLADGTEVKFIIKASS